MAALTSSCASRRSERALKHFARKRFGQHFLTDSGIIDAIVDAGSAVRGETFTGKHCGGFA